jgi:hypothetical protein
MFNLKQCYLWLVMMISGGLVFPAGLLGISAYVEVLHSFKVALLNSRIPKALGFGEKARMPPTAHRPLPIRPPAYPPVVHPPICPSAHRPLRTAHCPPLTLIGAASLCTASVVCPLRSGVLLPRSRRAGLPGGC